MAYDRKAEIEAILETDVSSIANTWRGDRDGLSLDQQAELAGAKTSNYGYNNRSVLSALIEGRIPSSPTMAQQARRKVTAWLKKMDLSPDLRRDLQELEQELRLRAEDREAQAVEDSNAARVTESAEAAGTPGVYVYTPPHYLKYPVDPDTGKTLLKVGHSAFDTYYRVNSQGRLAALPEDPVLLRIYPTPQSEQTEKRFHEWLRSADHAAPRSKRAGSEWFVTSTKFLDQIATSLDLEIRQVVAHEVGDE